MDSSSSTSSTSSAAPKRKRTSVAGSGEGSKEGDAIELSDSEGEGAEKGTAKKQKELKGNRSGWLGGCVGFGLVYHLRLGPHCMILHISSDQVSVAVLELYDLTVLRERRGLGRREWIQG
jgi:hypothetical protein